MADDSVMSSPAEKTTQHTTEDDFHRVDSHNTFNSYGSDQYSYYSEYEESNIFRRMVDSFKPYDYSLLPNMLNPTQSGGSGDTGEYSQPIRAKDPKQHPYHPQFDYSRLTELERAAIVTSTAPLTRSLKARHLSMISVSSSIGLGLWVGTGSALSSAGPLGLLLVWLFVSSIIYVTMSSLAEMAATFPVSGSFVTYNTFFVDSSYNFAMAWNYAMQWLVTMPLELVAAAITIDYWNPGVNKAVFVAIFYLIILVVNLFGVKGYGEVESVFSVVKIAAVVGFLILSVILVCGGGPTHDFIGGRNWHEPEGGMFNSVSPFKNMCSTIFTAAFSYAGVELYGLASAETQNPLRSIHKSKKNLVYYVLVFYILAVLMVGLLVSYKSPELIGSGLAAAAGVDVNVSPFVIAIRAAKIPVLPSIMNAVIIITTLSIGNSSVYGSSRTLAALGALRQGPRILGYIDRNGRPLVALAIQFVFGLLCFLVASPNEGQTIDVFQWMLSISGLGSLLTYFSICLCHIRFRSALRSRAREPKDELVYCASVYGSYYGLVTIPIIMGLQFWASLFPAGNGGKADLESFFMSYLGGFVILAFYIAHKVYAWWFMNIPLTKFYLTNEEINVDAGRRDIDLEVIKQEMAEERMALRERLIFVRIFKFFC